MSDQFIFKVAEAIYNSDFDGDPSQAFADRDIDVIGTYLNGAKAAVAAMRDPTEAMVSAGMAADGPRYRWALMIDAALQPDCV